MALELNKAHRRELNALTSLAKKDLALIWRDFGTAEIARDSLMDILPNLIGVYGEAAATLAADFYDDAREVSGVKGSFRAIPAELKPKEAIQITARWAVSPLFKASPDPMAALALASGGMQRSIADASRLTVVQSSLEDPGSEGWIRVGNGGCEWCAQYIDGEVHYVDGYDFDAHDHCNCTAVSVFSGQRARDYLRDVQEEDRPSPLRGFDAMPRAQVEKQIAILEGLKDSDYRTKQLKKLRTRLAGLD